MIRMTATTGTFSSATSTLRPSAIGHSSTAASHAPAATTSARDNVSFSDEAHEDNLVGAHSSASHTSAAHKSPASHSTDTAHKSASKPKISSGQSAVNIAKKFLGEDSINVRGHLKNYQAAGGVTNDCADFATSVEMDAGRLKKHEINVGVEMNDLPKEGWEKEPQSKAQPGDLVVFPSYHTAIVENKGGTEEIGSNGTSVESISQVPTWGPAIYYKPDSEK